MIDVREKKIKSASDVDGLIARVVMPPRKPKALKREYADADDDADDDAYDPAREGEDELKMKITKKPKKSKTTTKLKQEPGKDGDEPDAPAKSNAPQKIGFDIATGPIQDEALHAKYNAMSLDELKQYMQARLKFLRRFYDESTVTVYTMTDD